MMSMLLFSIYFVKRLKLSANFDNLHHIVYCVGFNVETVEYKNISFTVWDVGGQDKVFLYFYI